MHISSFQNTFFQLPPKDYVHLAATCKELRRICFGATGVSVRFKLYFLVNTEENAVKFTFAIVGMGKQLSWEEMQPLLRLPFSFVVTGVYFFNLQIPTNETVIAATRYYLIRFGVKKFNRLAMESHVGNWKQLVSLAQALFPLTFNHN